MSHFALIISSIKLLLGINGYVYANLPGLTMCVNDKVSWHVLAVGDDVDLHSVYFHGQTFTRYDTNRDSVSLVPGSTATLKMVPDNAGTYSLLVNIPKQN